MIDVWQITKILGQRTPLFMTGTQRFTVLGIPGSSRTNSSNEAILRTVGQKFAERLELHLFEGLRDLPLFSPDLDVEPAPESVREFRARVAAADAVLICTPEYVFSPPAALKNALEWCVSTMVFTDKPVGIMVAAGHGERTLESLALILTTIQARVGANSRLLLKGARAKINPAGELADPAVLSEIAKLIKDLESPVVVAP